MKTENPYPINNTLLESYQRNSWNEGYAAAMADNAPIAFKDRLPMDGEPIILYNEFENKLVCSGFTPKYHEMWIVDFKYSTKNGFHTHWLPLLEFPQTNSNQDKIA